MTSAWSVREVEALRVFAPLGVEGVAVLLERSPSAIAAQAKRNGISLVATASDIDAAAVPERVLRWVKVQHHVPLCPSCTQRVALIKSTGLCRVCHLDRLIAASAEELEVRARRQRLAALRQKRRRMRVCVVCGVEFFPKSSSELKCLRHR
ncbi:MAG: hypothetical protein KGL39_26580 [Patescibacteria group bacterium]|nr:hypothetical protein [Patescibacteria group bacterium]